MLRPVLGRGRVGNFLVRNKWRNYEAIQRCRDLPMLLLSSLRARASLRPGAACACLSHAHPAAGELQCRGRGVVGVWTPACQRVTRAWLVICAAGTRSSSMADGKGML